MYAVVLVGGFGTRLRPLTNDVPKPMLPVANRPMIVRLAERLAAGGVTDVVLALGFRPDAFAAAFPGDKFLAGDTRVRLHYAVEPEPLDTAGAIAFAARHVGIDDTFVVANGDVICDLDVAALIAAHRSAGAEATVHLTPVDDPSQFGVVEVASNGQVQRFVEKPAPGDTDSTTINAGTYVFEASVLDRIPPGRRVSVERETFPALVADGALFALATNDRWIDTGRPEPYLQANLDLADHPDATGAATVAPTATIVHSVIGDGCVVGEAAHVQKSVLLPGATVGAGASVMSSIVWGAVPADVTLDGCVVGAGHTVPEGHHERRRFPEPD